MNESQIASNQKPHSVSDSEWAEALRASQTGALRYVFLSRRIILGLAALFAGAFCYQLYAAHGDVLLAFTRTVRSGVFIGFAFFLLFAGIRRALDWRGKRQLVFREPLDARRS